MPRPILIDHSAHCFHSNEYNGISNYRYTTANERSRIMTWLSPLEPKLRHLGIQERRDNKVGEWLIQTEEFRGWHCQSRNGEGSNGVLFFYGDSGVSKAFIR